MGQDAPRLVWQVLGWVNHLRLQPNPLVNMLAVLHF
jgi:hypothetical protein